MTLIRSGRSWPSGRRSRSLRAPAPGRARRPRRRPPRPRRRRPLRRPPRARRASAAAFDWKKYSGTEITFLANQHPWTDGMKPLLDQFTQETGIKVNLQPFSEDLYFDKMEQVLRANPGTADVYFLPMDSTGFSQFSAGLIEPLTPYLNDPTKTSAGLRPQGLPAGLPRSGHLPARVTPRPSCTGSRSRSRPTSCSRTRTSSTSTSAGSCPRRSTS